MAKIDQLLKEKSLVRTPGVFRVVTGTFGTPEAAKQQRKKIGFNAFEGREGQPGLYWSLYIA